MPREFTGDFQPFTYKHVDCRDESFDDDEARCQFPNLFSKSSVIYPIHPEYKDFMFEKDWPSNVDGYIARSLPQLGLRITSFKDVTLLAVTWPHTALDGASKRDLLQAWSLSLAGKVEKIKPALGAHDDIAWKLAGGISKDELVPDVLKEKRLTGLDYYLFLFGVIWRTLWERDRNTKLFLLPRAVIQKWRDNGLDAPSDLYTGNGAFVTDGDFITAWQVKLTAASFPKSSCYSAIGCINARPFLTRFFEAGGVYLQNLFTLSFSPVSAIEAAGSIAGIAAAIRRGLAEQLAGDQMIHHFRRHRHEIETGQGDGVKNIFCRSDEISVLCNNLSGLRIASSIDFGPAVLPSGDGTRASGAVVSHFYRQKKQSHFTQPLFVVMDQNEDGYVIGCSASKKVWAMIERDIAFADGVAGP